MQTKPSPNMLRTRMPPRQHPQEMFRLEEVLDFPAELVHVVGVTKAAFSVLCVVGIYCGGSSARLSLG